MNFLTIALFQLTRFASASTAHAASCSRSFMGLATWYAYFPDNWFGNASPTADAGSLNNSFFGNCDVNNNFQFLSGSGQSGLLLIGLAVLDDLLRIATLVAVGYVIYGGFLYMTSQGSPDGTKRAQGTIINALVGLVIAILAASIVSFIGNKLGG